MSGRSSRVLQARVDEARALASRLADAGLPADAALGRLERLTGSDTVQTRVASDVLVALVQQARSAGRASLVEAREFRSAVRHLADELGLRHPGQAIEVRVPPMTAVQIGAAAAGPTHTRGTPPNVVETDPETWFELATGTLTFADAAASHRLTSSGAHAAELAGMLPVV